MFLQRLFAALSVLCLCACASSKAANESKIVLTPTQLASLESTSISTESHKGVDWETIKAHPLGSRENPIRSDMPSGQRAYLKRLRCADDKKPAFSRQGNFGVGPYGRVIDGYQLTCPDGSQVMIFLDMYHPDYVEDEAVSGFTLAKK